MLCVSTTPLLRLQRNNDPHLCARIDLPLPRISLPVDIDSDRRNTAGHTACRHAHLESAAGIGGIEDRPSIVDADFNDCAGKGTSGPGVDHDSADLDYLTTGSKQQSRKDQGKSGSVHAVIHRLVEEEGFGQSKEAPTENRPGSRAQQPASVYIRSFLELNLLNSLSDSPTNSADNDILTGATPPNIARSISGFHHPSGGAPTSRRRILGARRRDSSCRFG